MQNKAATTYIQTLTLIYLALAIGQLTFLWAASQFGGINPELHLNFKHIAPAVVIIGVLAGSFIYMSRMNQIKPEQSLHQKLQNYTIANIMRWALLEGSAMFCLVCYFLTGNIWYAYLFASAFLPFLINRPSLDKCLQQLPLNESEKSILQQNTPF